MLHAKTTDPQQPGRQLTPFDLLYNLTSPPGGFLKRLLRTIFFIAGEAIRRLPGFAALSNLARSAAPGAWTWYESHHQAYRKLAHRPRFKFNVDALAPTAPLRKVHQFHSGSATGDAITNSMLLVQRTLRGLGYDSEIFVEHRDPALADRLFEVTDLPRHNDYVLIVHHSIGYDICDRIAALPVNKVLMYHNITPPEFLKDAPALADYAALGRAQLDLLRGKVVSALADSEYNVEELLAAGFDSPVACPFLFDVDELLAKAGTRRDHSPDAPFTVLFVGRIVSSKGQADLVDAFAEFCQRYRAPARLALVGRIAKPDDPYLVEIKQRIAQHGLGDSVILTGAVSQEELRRWYAASDVYVSLSLHEGFGVPLVEAMASGIPVIAWPAGAVASTLGGAATLLAAREPAVAATAINDIARDRDGYAEQVARQFRSLDRFRLNKVIPILTNALTQAGLARLRAPG
jgi:glycosyltransferase involved in cell wall biosynthesis